MRMVHPTSANHDELAELPACGAGRRIPRGHHVDVEARGEIVVFMGPHVPEEITGAAQVLRRPDRKSTRLNSSHVKISYAVFCLKKKRKTLHILSHPTQT